MREVLFLRYGGNLKLALTIAFETIEFAFSPNPEERIIYRTAFEYPDILRAALASGARGFITEDTPIREIEAVIKRVYQGGIALDKRYLSMVLGYFMSTSLGVGSQELKARIEALPGHLRQIVDLVGRAYSNKETAAVTGLSLNTVATCVKHALSELGVRRGELTIQMARLRLRD